MRTLVLAVCVTAGLLGCGSGAPAAPQQSATCEAHGDDWWLVGSCDDGLAAVCDDPDTVPSCTRAGRAVCTAMLECAYGSWCTAVAGDPEWDVPVSEGAAIVCVSSSDGGV